MPTKLKSKILVVVLVFSASAISYFITAYKVESHAVIRHVNSELYDLNEEMDLLEYWNKNLKNDKYLEKHIKILILTKILILSNVKPPLAELKGVPLEALSRAITYHNKYGLTYGEHDDVFQNSLLYLKTIESSVDEIIKKSRMKPKGRTGMPGET